MALLDSEYNKANATAKRHIDANAQVMLRYDQLTQKVALQRQKVEELTKAQEKINKSIQEAPEKIEKLTRSYKDEKAKLEELKKTQDEESDAVKKQQSLVDELKHKLDSTTNAYDKSGAKLEEATIKLNNAKTELVKMKDSLDDATKAANEHGNAFGRLGDKISDIKQVCADAGFDLDKLGDSMLKVGGVLVGIGVAAAKMTMDFDQEMAKARTIMDESEMSFDKLKGVVLETSSSFGLAAGDVADAAYELLSAGTATKDIGEALNSAALLAKVGFTDTATAVDVLTSFTNAYNLSIKDQRELVDKLVLAQKNGKFTIDELGGSFGRVAGLAKESGVSIDELLAMLATLTETGLSADEAVTAISATLNNVIKPSKGAADAAASVGINFDIATLKSMGLENFMGKVARAMASGEVSATDLFGSVRALNAVMQITGSGADSFSRNLTEIKEASGTAEDALEKLQTPGEELGSAFNNLKNALIETGGSFQGVISALAGFLNWVAQLNPKIVTFGVGLGVVLLVAGGAIKIFSTLGDVVSGVGKAIGFITGLFHAKTAATAANTAVTAANTATEVGATAATTGLTIANGALTVSMGAVVGVIVIVIALVALLVILFLALSGRGKNLSLDIKQSMSDISGVMSDTQKSLNNTSNQINNMPEYKKMQSLGSGSATSWSGYSYADGTDFASGGVSLVGEEGPELVELPRGSKVYTAGQTRTMRRSGSYGGYGGDNYEEITINISVSDLDSIDDIVKLRNFVYGYRQTQRSLGYA